ncbi:hypothetical protein [Xenorhabdus bovienii]
MSDTIIVHPIDRLCRNMMDMCSVGHYDTTHGICRLKLASL